MNQLASTPTRIPRTVKSRIESDRPNMLQWSHRLMFVVNLSVKEIG
jgi:hypothetical protein